MIETGVRMMDHRHVSVLSGTITLLGAVVASCCVPFTSLSAFDVGVIVVGLGQSRGIVYTVYLSRQDSSSDE